jgi:hypothetical protein
MKKGREKNHELSELILSFHILLFENMLICKMHSVQLEL